METLIRKHSTIKPTNALYFLSMSSNPTYVSAAIEPSLGVQGECDLEPLMMALLKQVAHMSNHCALKG
jgi:hypothetical protein